MGDKSYRMKSNENLGSSCLLKKIARIGLLPIALLIPLVVYLYKQYLGHMYIIASDQSSRIGISHDFSNRNWKLLDRTTVAPRNISPVDVR